jgi:hypothetical protein
MQALMLVARGGPTMLASIGVMRALHRNKVRAFTTRKETPWGKRKLKRDGCVTSFRPRGRSIGSSKARLQPTKFLPRIVPTCDLAMPRFDPMVWSGPACVVRQMSRVGPIFFVCHRSFAGEFLADVGLSLKRRHSVRQTQIGACNIKTALNETLVLPTNAVPATSARPSE